MLHAIATGMTLATLVFVDGISLADGDGPPAPPLPVTVMEESPRTLDGILNAWVKASRDFGAATTEFECFVYDVVFETEKRSRGTYSYARPFDFRAEFQPAPIKPGDVGRMRNQSGEPYTLVPGTEEVWRADGTRLRYVRESGKVVELLEFPKRDGVARGVDIKRSLFSGIRIEPAGASFVRGITRDDVTERFQWSLGSIDGDRILLHARPRTRIDSVQYSKIDILLDRRDYLTQAIRIHDSARTKETVYSFDEWRAKPLREEQSVDDRAASRQGAVQCAMKSRRNKEPRGLSPQWRRGRP